MRSRPEDFLVSEELGFELSGDGEHVFLHLEKRNLNTLDLVTEVARLAGVPRRDVGYSGLKDRNAVTRQWLSVGLAGRQEPQWSALEREQRVRVLDVTRHRRKLRRGVHEANRFTLVLRDFDGDRDTFERRCQQVREQGVPHYFGEQRFGRNGATLEQALHWMRAGGRIPRERRSLYLSALRSSLFNHLLASRVEEGTWNTVCPTDVCMLRGSRSWFVCDAVDKDIVSRAASGDIAPGIPLWGRGELAGGTGWQQRVAALAHGADICDFLEQSGLDLGWRAGRLLPDDFCWRFCDDGSLQLDFALAAGCYATALLAECLQYK